jgi:beta-aspartyl-peptidase (threonine type)
MKKPKQKTLNKYTLLIHGGTGAILRENMTSEKEKLYKKVLTSALKEGERILKANGTGLDAVEKAIRVMEDSDLFNAGKGSVFNHDGKNEMDASIMDGKTLNAGAIAGVSNLKNPITAARKVMENSEHVMLVGLGAEYFAQKEGCDIESPDYFYSKERYEQLQHALKNNIITLDHSSSNSNDGANIENGTRKLGTVGAVALDSFGNLAAATSTGGMTNKKHGRLGDTPIIGAGTYANNSTCAVSCTGHGEHFIRNVVAYDISALIEYKKLNLKEATNYVIINKLGKQGIEGGLIAIDSKGNFEMIFNSSGMYRGSISSSSNLKVEIYKE